MERTKNKTLKIATILIAALLVSSTLVLLSSAGTMAVSAQTNTNDLLQYEWTQLGANQGWTLFSAGPAPNYPIVAWTRTISGLSAGFAGTLTAFNGKVFATTTTTVTALDGFTGQTIWTFTRAGANFQSSPTKIDDTYMFLDGDSGAGGLGIGTTAGTITNATVTVLRTSDGTFVSNFTVVGVGFQPGAGGYFPGRYDPETRTKLVRGYNAQTNELSYYGIDLSNPAAPTLKWKHVLDESGEELSVGGGVALVGTVNGAIIAMNISTGDVVWRALKVGFAQYTATYVDGSFIQGSSSTTLTRYNATTGEIIWDKPQGGRAFFAFAGATGYGRFYQHNIAIPDGYVGCWDVATGNMLWKQPALYNIGYITPVLADGKLYLQRTSGTAGGFAAEVNEFACYDAFTGEFLWAMPKSIVNPSIAYGNLYVIVGSAVYCISDRNTQDWTMWRGSTDFSGITQSTGPYGNSTNGFTPEFIFPTQGALTSSPAVVDGKVYFGSQDKNIYCVDAFTGAKIWNFTTQYRVFSSPAVVGGVVYTGADDGYVYALNANTGAQQWKTAVGGGFTNFVFAATWQPRSSPIVVGSKIYVGALDGKFYCLETADGRISWTQQLGDATHPIAGSAAYSNGYVYIDACNHNLYKLDANSGAVVWRTTSNATIARAYTDFFPWSTPAIFNNTVYWGAGPVYGLLIWYALNETTGKQIWNLTSNSQQTPQPNTFTGNTPTCQTPVVFQWNNSLSVMIVSEFMGVSIFNANNGARIWRQFLGHEVYSSVAYANDTRDPKFYIGSDTYAITAFNMSAAVRNDTARAVLASYTTLSHVQSSPTVWDGKLYVTSADNNLYMFRDSATTEFSIYSAASKTGEMWNNETLSLSGKLSPVATENWGSFPTNSMPFVQVIMSVTKPDGNTENLTATTDVNGNFNFQLSPTAVGTYGWVVFYEGANKTLIQYKPAYTEYSTISVSAAPLQPTATPPLTETPTATPSVTETPTVTPEVTPTATPAQDGLPVEYIYAIVAVIVIVVIAVAAYMFMKRGKKE